MPGPIQSYQSDLANALYLAGVGLQQIQDKTGIKTETIERRAERGDWHKLRSDVLATLPSPKQDLVTHEPDSFQSRTLRVQAKLAAKIEQTIDNLPAKVPVRQDKLSSYVQLQGEVVNQACKIFGLDQTKPSSSISIGTINVLRSLPDRAPDPDPKQVEPVVDVEPSHSQE